MRADRLLSLLLILQTHGRQTAAQLSSRLEVSERTIYRDIDALGAAGVPVYSDPGPHGGFSLLDSYRTTLTGLTSDEIRALFMLSIPAPLVELGLSEELRNALLKLSAALPQRHQPEQAFIRQRFYLDTTWWEQPGDAPAHLHTLHQAVSADRLLAIRYRSLSGVPVERQVEPYGLVAKAGAWYLVYAIQARLRVLQVSDLQDARVVAAGFTRLADFDLTAFWDTWCAEHERRQLAFTATLLTTERLAPHLARGHSALPPDAPQATSYPTRPGWQVLRLAYPSFEDARRSLLGYGRAVEVLEPLALRRSLLDYAEQIIDLYRN